jgi:hypothetical protein
MTAPLAPAPEPPVAVQPAPREQRLVEVLSRARGRSKLVVSERWLFTLGGALALIGIVLVLIGWVGTSQTVLVAGQIPYLVSGGLLGLGCIFLGGFMYFGYWLATLVREGRERGEQDRADLARLAAGVEEATRALTAMAALMEERTAAPRRRA